MGSHGAVGKGGGGKEKGKPGIADPGAAAAAAAAAASAVDEVGWLVPDGNMKDSDELRGCKALAGGKNNNNMYTIIVNQ